MDDVPSSEEETSDIDTGSWSDDEDMPAPQALYTILSEKDIKDRQAEAIDNVWTVLSVSKTDAGILLRHFKWSVSRVNDAWFADEARVRETVGLIEWSVEGDAYDGANKLTCWICFDTLPREDMKAPVCRHYFCESCWTGYIHTAINDGPGCLTLRCPHSTCSAAVGEDMVLSLASEEDAQKYHRYLLRSYVEDNRKVKWCPAPGCEFAVELIPGSTVYDVTCKCGHQFCWNCLEEAHRPVDCDTVAKWILKNSAESENMNWILANSKPCPKCKRPIEKNQGCMHMSCTPPCKYEFCWLCLGAWSEHGERTGGFYACNRYEIAKQEGVYDEAERRREMAKNSLEKYTHYYERWATNESSRVKAKEDLIKLEKEKIEDLSNKQCQPVSQLKFVADAMAQVVECRRVLKWTYAYGYYLKVEEQGKRDFFEYLQGEAEHGLERLQECAEKDLKDFLQADGPKSNFNEFRTKLAGLTSVTRIYFQNLVRALENGLSDVDPAPSPSRSGSSKGIGSSKLTVSKSLNGSRRGSASGSASRRTGGGDEPEYWTCGRCTYGNPMAAEVCDMCQNVRGL
ncbi:hypothetical protein CBR_g11204 [Chara braunii]|uniref:RanBP-type and C3HC4-type zinc finger-containing protein 1 n=1 Tax=Chara braunii TaxID=69332 RepID=A0A388KQF9_CHABU|nr:hypothetical protein CBR_g11204 [Chara braunii]|eukprot:GBG72276.1 hypothetical protein CBR_g11204 [Chara braunii]